MKMVKDKKLVVGADFAGYPLKEVVVAHLKAKGWEIEDVGVKSPDDNDTENMFHRVGLRVGAKISEGEFERALIFCGTGMGIHIAASKCPHVHAGVVESVPAALRAITGNGVNVLVARAFGARSEEDVHHTVHTSAILALTGNSTPFTATGILIVVSVAMETTQQLEAQMMMRHYKGFMK